MTGIVLLVVALALVGASGAVFASLIGVRSSGERVLAAYVLSFAEIVSLALLLSVFGTMTRGALVLGAALIFIGAVGAALLFGTAIHASLPRRESFSIAVRTRPVLVLGILAALALAYVVALIVGTPPNGWDPLNYHLARAGLWLEAGQVGYVDSAYDERLNFNPPNAEIAVAALLGIARHEEVAGLVQLGAALACTLGVFCFARRIRMSLGASLFGALLFLLLPIVVLQSSTAKNDLVVASFLVAAGVFVLGRSSRDLVLAGIATALALGVKFTAAYGLVVLVLLALTAAPRAAWWKRLCALATGAAVGAYWYAVNAAESGRVLGDQTNVPGLTAVLSGPENVVTAFGLLVDFVDLSGAVGRDLYVFVIVAVLLAAAMLLAGRGGRKDKRGALVAGGLVLVALPLYALSTRIGRPALVRLYEALDSPQGYLAEGDAVASSAATASDTASWFGPAGLVLVVGIAVVAVVLVRRRELPLVALVAAGAPALWLVMLALTLTYHPWQGRFFVFPVALSASLWGLALRHAPVAWGLTALAGTTAALSLVHFVEKPSGIRVLERASTPSVWQMPRAEVQSLHDPPLEPLLDYVERTVPAETRLALALGANEFGYPFFDATGARAIVLVPWGSTATDVRTDWLVANPERAATVDRACWDERFVAERGSVLLRRAGAC